MKRLKSYELSTSPVHSHKKWDHDHIQPTEHDEEPVYGKVDNKEVLQTSVLFGEERVGNIPSKLKGMTTKERRIHMCLFVGCLSVTIFLAIILFVFVTSENL